MARHGPSFVTKLHTMARRGPSFVKKMHTKRNSVAPKAHDATMELWQRKGDRRTSRPGSCGSLLGGALVCESIEDWLQPDCHNYRALYVPRIPTWADIQCHVDSLAESCALGEDFALHEEIQTSGGYASEQRFSTELSQKARRIVGKATRFGLPAEVGRQLQEDYERIGMTLSRLVPAARMSIKLELIRGEFGCPRWHQDHYIGRAVVAYNSCGTDFVDHKNVDFWELHNCGDSDCIIRDKSQVCSANVGDLLFMKGKTFPSYQNGLVHRSPEQRFHANGKMMSRLLLKVDLL